MDLALRLLFHRFQIIFDRIRLNFSVAVGTIKTNVLLSLGDRVREYHVQNKQAPREPEQTLK